MDNQLIKEEDISNDIILQIKNTTYDARYTFPNVAATIGSGHYLDIDFTYRWISMHYGSNFPLHLENNSYSSSFNDNTNIPYVAWAQNWGTRLVLRENGILTTTNTTIRTTLHIDEKGTCNMTRTRFPNKSGLSYTGSYTSIFLILELEPMVLPYL